MSGVVSILFAGITMKHYTHNNISAEAQDMYVVVSAFCISTSLGQGFSSLS